ncbi:hypothetical protein J2T22_000617 [Pseudarthrobacter defluvii]|uniref:Uncharacterized protein n=1 Tax=Pseudarthrobacter defluvii TaxID=410837 RepID=A0ABT9UDV2_9MICC|nr:hypothetical protein [Pseudarthrobacter defluvii]MDQ0117447.1 hypothetical protein [Pseudarthrobacter defluvii]
MNQTTKYPASVRELGDMAEALGMLPSELLEMLGPIPMPPVGYTLTRKSSHRWTGTETYHRRFIVTPVWDATTGHHSVDVWMADHERPNYSNLTPAEAADLAGALLEATATARAAEQK